jgi:hypothetical protein
VGTGVGSGVGGEVGKGVGAREGEAIGGGVVGHPNVVDSEEVNSPPVATVSPFNVTS